MAKWTHSVNGARIEIDADALSRELQRIGAGPVNRMAAEGVLAARSALSPSDASRIKVKATKQFKLKSGKLPRLSQMLDVPVALVVNNSKWAHSLEFGTSRKNPPRPLQKAFEALRGKASRAERGSAG